MDYNTLSIHELLEKLDYSGREPHPDLISAIWAQRLEMEPLLLILFRQSFDDDWPYSDDPRWYRFYHAGKFMISWQNADALPIFVRLYSSTQQEILDGCEWFEEDLHYYGPTAVPFLKEIISSIASNKWHYGSSLAGSTLTKIATYFPETREEIIQFFRAQLPQLPTLEEISSISKMNEHWANWAGELALLGDTDSRNLILELYKADLLFDDFFHKGYYLRDLNRGFKPKKPPRPYDIVKYYRSQYEAQKRWEKKRERFQKENNLPNKVQDQHSIPKVGRNHPCPCGSGKKYKKCHGRL